MSLTLRLGGRDTIAERIPTLCFALTNMAFSPQLDAELLTILGSIEDGVVSNSQCSLSCSKLGLRFFNRFLARGIELFEDIVEDEERWVKERMSQSKEISVIHFMSPP